MPRLRASLLVFVCCAAMLVPSSARGSGGASRGFGGCTDPPLLGEAIGNHKEVFQPPANATVQPAWLATITAWRASCRSQIRYSSAIYHVPRLRWARTNFVQPQSHPYDRYFFNSTTQRYSVDAFLEDLRVRYGGIDSVLLWPSYPLIGLDDRSQYEIFEALPGGLAGLREMVGDMHQRGVHVLFPWNGWDQFTCPDGLGRTDAVRWATLLNATDADGANADSAKSGDTQNDGTVHLTSDFYASTVANGKPVAWQCEGGPSPEEPTSLNWQVMDIGYWGGMEGHYTGGGGGSWSFAPAVDKWKWVDSRRMTVISDRYSTNKTDNLQHAYFNGVGWEAWENIWGSWNGIVPADGEALRRSAHILRFFGRLGFTQAPNWEPHTTEVLQSHTVFGSRWPLGEETLWTLVNRGSRNVSGAQLRLQPRMVLRYFDCYHGTPLHPVTVSSTNSAAAGASAGVVVNSTIQLAFSIEALGFGCIFATPHQPDANLTAFLREMAAMTVRPLASYDKNWRPLPQTIDPVARTPIINTSKARQQPPNRMVLVQGTSSYKFESTGVELEGGKKGISQAAQIVDVMFPWESAPSKQHTRNLTMAGFLIDQFPVTIQEYSKYLVTSGYVPKDSHNWLKNWDWLHAAAAGGTGIVPKMPEVLAHVPVTYVSFAEATGYCNAQGKRLPSTIEWQYAGQGTTNRMFPWGEADDPGCRPVLHNNRTLPGALPVETYATAKCSSVFNVSDMIGNVWQLTSSFTDSHTRRVVLKGGSNYRPTYKPGVPAFNLNKADFYYPQARNLIEHNIAFLMSDSFERAGTVGFRCARDV